jgi:hypothetical protein
MYARAVDEAAGRLRTLRQEAFADLGLATIVFAASMAATQFRPAFALPLFVGGLYVGALGVGAVWRRWDLVDQLAEDRDAYAIPEIRAYASRLATMRRRRDAAALIRCRVIDTGSGSAARLAPAAAELGALVSELEDEDLVLDPLCAVACVRLSTDYAVSPLLNAALSVDDLRSTLRLIRSGFASRTETANADAADVSHRNRTHPHYT